MRVAHRHCQGLVAEQLSDGANIYSGHNQSTGKGVPEAMPGEAFDPGSFHCGIEPTPCADQGGPSLAMTREYVLAAFALRVEFGEGSGRDGVEGDVANVSILCLGQRENLASEIDLFNVSNAHGRSIRTLIYVVIIYFYSRWERPLKPMRTQANVVLLIS